MRIAVCEDDRTTCVNLAGRTHVHMPDAHIDMYQNAEELLAAERKPDIVLMDVELGGMDGMEASRELRRRGDDCSIIFVTGQDQYVYDAFDVDAAHYLLKPVDDLRLRDVLLKASEQLRMRRGHSMKRQIVVSSGGRHVRVPLDSIRYAEVFNRTIVLHTAQGDIEYYGKLGQLAELCGSGFARTHRAYLVNMAYVQSYSAQGAYTGTEQIPIARSQYKKFVTAFMDYIRENGQG